MNPEKVLVFRGELQGPNKIEGARYEKGIRITWEIPVAHSGKLLVVLAYAPENGLVIFEKGLAHASDGQLDWDISEKTLTESKHIHVYAAFYHIGTGKLSDSSYVGCI